MHDELQRRVHETYLARARLAEAENRAAVEKTLALLDRGEVRTAEPGPEGWVVHAWVAEAINLYFAMAEMHVWEVPPFTFHDKIPIKSNHAEAGVRVVPPGTARYGSFLGRGVVLMPGYVNIGAYVGPGTMVDTWATVGTGAQIGSEVHLAGGVGIGGILEPPGSRPVIVEDGAFIGSRCILVEGVQVAQLPVVTQPGVTPFSTPSSGMWLEETSSRRHQPI